MTQFTDRKQIEKATDIEIEQFFSETVFEGIYSSELKSENSDFYKGSITDIKLDGRPTNIVRKFLNVPHKSTDIQEGPCSFKCRMNIKAFREQGFYKVNLMGSTLTSIQKLTESNVSVSASDSQEKELFEMWGVDDCQFIGYYHYDEERNIYIIEDLRKPNFDHIPYYPGDTEKKPIQLHYSYSIKGIKEDDYYLFTWKLSHRNIYNPYEIVLDFKTQPKPIDPEWFINKLFEDRHNDKSKNFGSATNFLDTLSKQLSAKESTFVYELLQNANDYPVEGQKVDVEFHITDKYLLFLHTGDKFNVRNISGICGINEKEKVANKKTIGYKGIGFKTVFLNNHYVYIKTGDYSFRFDEGETPEKKFGGKIKRLEAPFQILPIWTNHNEVADEVNAIFDKTNDRFRVQIALRPDNNNLLHIGRNCYEKLFRDVFSDSNIILFIPNINSVRVFINGEEERTCFRNNDEWVVGEYDDEINEELQTLINKTIEKGNSRIPEKYKDFSYTKVSFACKHSGAIITPIEDAIIYCYLPTKASWGLPFLMNTDMIPKGDRNDVETEVKLIDEKETNFNEELASIAGEKLFLWIKDLLTSKKYHLGSVFSLVPDFNKCKKEHRDYLTFIEKFEESFKTCLFTETIVPIYKGIAPVNRVILDTTGLSSSGIMTDEEFYKFAEVENYFLPLPILRKDKHFVSFLKRYAEDNQTFDKDCLLRLISNSDFKEWLKVQDNNNKFLNFLLENDYLEDYLDEEIFIEEECGNLFSAEKLYYDIDDELKDLSAFSDYLYYLSLKTREFFKDNKKWENAIENHFDKFDGNDFINTTLLGENWDATIKILKDWDSSFHFYDYLAKNKIVPDDLCSLPFFNDAVEAEIVDDFNDKFVFLSSHQGKKICSLSWLSSVEFAFVSTNYSNSTIEYLKENAVVNDYSDEFIIKNIILSEDYQDKINEVQQNSLENSLSFIKFCFDHNSSFGGSSLRNYALYASDCNGNDEFVLYDNHIYLPSSGFDKYSEKDWLDCDMMYCLDSSYLSVNPDKSKVKNFFKEVFLIDELNAETFYLDIVRPNINKIISNTSGNNDGDGTKNFDFISYLDENYKLIFDEEKDAEKFASFVLLEDSDNDNLYDIDPNASYVYAYDNELKKIIESEWFPADTVSMCSRKYGNSKSILAIKAQEYDFATFFNDVISIELDSINNTINSKQASIAFHEFIIDRLSDLTDKQKEVMKGTKIYLYGSEIASDRSEGHYILSSSARELSSLGLVEFSDLNIIDPDYHIEENEEYWKTRLGNEQFTVLNFISWLNENYKDFYLTLEKKDNNIKFWRWLKDCNLADQTLIKLPTLPVYLKGGKQISDSDDIIYLSDAYIDEGGLETIVTNFNPNAKFIDEDYIGQNDRINSWKEFWVKIGMRFEMIDILIDTIDNRLSETEETKLPLIITKFRHELEKHYDGNLSSKLTGLQVKANDGNFYNLSDIIYVDCEKEEPFKYIDLPTQVSFATADERKLIIDILDEIKANKITKLSDWQKVKIDRYLEIQDNENNEELLRSIHFRFVDELAAIYIEDKDGLKEFDQIYKVLFLNSNDEFTEISEMTEGSLYKPFCDFEKYGLVYDYISNSYLQECKNDIRKMFNRFFKIHCDFEKEDIKNLSNREFAIYFWSQYLIKKDADISGIKKLIEEREFDTFACIPTKDCMKKPNELYSLSISTFVVKHVPDWENKLPLKTIPEIEYDREGKRTLFGLLLNKPSNLRLAFCDALYALYSISSQEKRSQLLQWMIETYEEKYDTSIKDYRTDKSAVWKNTKNQNIPISDLYALSYNDKKLEQYFGNLPQIINKDYLPSNSISFKKGCDILKIPTIEPNDLIVDPIGQVSRNDLYKHNLKIFALVIAGYEDSEEWFTRYQKYKELIDGLELWCCSAITIKYKHDDQICQNLKKFYHEKDSYEFYFVKSLDEKRVFKPFVESFIEYLDIDADKDLVENIMDSQDTAIEFVQDNNNLKLDEKFKDELDLLIHGIKQKLNGNEARDVDVYDNDTRPVFREHIPHSPEYTNINIEEAFDNFREETFDDDDKREAIDNSDIEIDDKDFCNITKMYYRFNGQEIETICEHYRNGIWVRGHYRNGTWVNGYWRSGSNVNSHTRQGYPSVSIQEKVNDNHEVEGNEENNSSNNGNEGIPHIKDEMKPTYTPEEDSEKIEGKTVQYIKEIIEDEDDVEDDEPHNILQNKGQKPVASTANLPSANKKTKGAFRGYWAEAPQDSPAERKHRSYSNYTPEQFKNRQFNVGTQEPLTLSRRDISDTDVQYLSNLLGKALNTDTIKDENYIVRMRFYNSLKENDLDMDMDEREYVEHGSSKIITKSGKYVHRCSARSGILYISPTVWNRLREGSWVICFYSGKMADQFVYVRTQEELMKIINQDALVIQVTGNDKKELVDKIYEDGFYGMEGNIYTLIRTIKIEGEVTPFDENITDYYSDDDDIDTDAL